MTDFPDRDEWTDRTFAPDSIEQQEALAEVRRELAAEAEEAMEGAEWDDLGATDLISAEELADIARKPTDLSNNQFSDV